MVLSSLILGQQWLKYSRSKGKSAKVIEHMSRNSSRKLKIQLAISDKLSQQKIILREKLDTLKSLDSKILELVEDENEKEYEVSEASESTDEMLFASIQLWNLCRLIRRSLQPPSTSTGNISLSPQSVLLLNVATAALNVEIRPKLPKLERKRFSGRPTEWQVFINCFDSAVHSNPKLSNIDKMNYLRALIEVQTQRQLKGSHWPRKTKPTREILEQRYGNKQSIISTLMDNLLETGRGVIQNMELSAEHKARQCAESCRCLKMWEALSLNQQLHHVNLKVSFQFSHLHA